MYVLLLVGVLLRLHIHGGVPEGTANGNADVPSRFPQPATDADRTGPNRLTNPDTVGIYPIRPCCFKPCEPFMPGIGLGGTLSGFLCIVLFIFLLPDSPLPVFHE